MNNPAFQTLRSAIFSAVPAAGGAGGRLGVGPGALPLAFCEVEFFGSSRVYSMSSGDPGMYLRSTSGTTTPCEAELAKELKACTWTVPARLFSLVILEHTAQGSFRRAQSGI